MFFINNPDNLLFFFLVIYLIFNPKLLNLNGEKRENFFHIFAVSQLFSTILIFIITLLKINQNSNVIQISYIYIIILMNTILALIVYRFKLGNFIKVTLKKYMCTKLFHRTLVVLITIVVIIHFFFPIDNWLRKYNPLMITILFSLNTISILYLDENS